MAVPCFAGNCAHARLCRSCRTHADHTRHPCRRDRHHRDDERLPQEAQACGRAAQSAARGGGARLRARTCWGPRPVAHAARNDAGDAGAEGRLQLLPDRREPRHGFRQPRLHGARLCKPRGARLGGLAGHRKNLLLPYLTDIGVAVLRAAPDDPRYIAVQLFGRPRTTRYEFKVRNTGTKTVAYEFAGKRYDLEREQYMTHKSCMPRDINVFNEPQEQGIGAL